MIKRIMSNELAKGSFILLIMMNSFNLINYFFHFGMARMLGPEGYGILAAMMSLAYIFTIPSEAIQTVITKYTSKFNAEKDLGRIKNLLLKALQKGFFASLILFILYSFLSFFIADFLKIDYWIVEMTGVLIFGYFLVPVSRGVLQGRKKFKFLGTNMIVESLSKLILGITFVLIGFGVYGAVGAVVTSVFIAFLISFPFMRDVLSSKQTQGKVEGIYSYSLPVFIVVLVIILMYSIDVMLAKSFFSAEEAGVYAVISLLGKMILFGTIAISKAMFPLSSERFERGGDAGIILKRSLLIIIPICTIALVLFAAFPELIITLMFGKEYISAKNILVYIGLAFTFLSLTNLILIYGLATHKIKLDSIFLFLFVILTLILFFIFNKTLLQFAIAFLISNFFMFLGSLIIINKSPNKR
ncbi:MAG: oligosaccharide flippase family protein [archaeon]